MSTTDLTNTAEMRVNVDRMRARDAVRHYHECRRDGLCRRTCRGAAIAYLARKTGWPMPMAAGAFDKLLEEG